jgi:hypothetical protein
MHKNSLFMIFLKKKNLLKLAFTIIISFILKTMFSIKKTCLFLRKNKYMHKEREF